MVMCRSVFGVQSGMIFFGSKPTIESFALFKMHAIPLSVTSLANVDDFAR